MVTITLNYLRSITEILRKLYPNDIGEHIDFIFIGNKNSFDCSFCFIYLDVKIELEACVCCRGNHQLRDVVRTTSWSRRASRDYASDTSVNAGPINLPFFLLTLDISNRGRLKGRASVRAARHQTGVELRCLLCPWILGAGLTVEVDEPLDLFSFILSSYRRPRNCRAPRTCV